MFNSPSSRLTPRRGPTPARPRDSISHSARAPRPSLFSESLPPPTPSIRSSRLAVSRLPPSPTSSAGETTRTVREYDSGERAIWARDDRFEVHSAGNVPREAQALVKKADFVTNTVSGHIDPVSGFAFIATPERCVAWNYQKRTHSSPTCYTFPAPPSYAHSAQVPVLATLYSGANAAEPGMVLVGPTGQVRFWDNVGIALANVERYTALDLELAEDDFAERLFRVDGSNFIITTTSALAFRLTITAQAGRVVPSLAPLTRPGGMFGRANPTIFPRSERGEGITAVASIDGATFLLSGRIMQKWILTPDHHRFAQEWDLQDIFERDFSQDDSTVVQLRDLVPCAHKLAALASYTEEQSTSYAQTHSYAIHLFSVHNGSLQTDRIIPLVYQPPSDARALDAPRLFVPASSPTAFVRFADAVVLVSLASNDDYEDVITLKDKGRNAFIGVGCVSAPVSSRRTAAPALTLMPILGGLVGIDILDGPSSDEKSATALLKSKIEQAVFYGDRSDNPLSFDLSPDAPGDVAAAAEEVSSEILASTSVHQPAVFELKPLLTDRLARLRGLMSFIKHSRLLNRVPQASRRRLSRDAEKAKAAIELWDYQNRLMEHLDSQSPLSLLADAIHSLTPHNREGEDAVRSFFRHQTPRLADLLSETYALFRRAASSAAPSADASADASGWVLEVNRIFIIILRAASLYRSEESAMYEIDEQRPAAEFWTASDGILNALEELYATTWHTLGARSRLYGTSIDATVSDPNDALAKKQKDQTVLKTQLADLAAVICTNMEDKIRTHSQREMNGGADPNDGIRLKRRWDEIRPKTIRPLVEIDRVNEAYALAEHHRDFETLVLLCHDPKAGRGEAKVQTYIETFGEDFAFVLYLWYIEKQRFNDLFNQDEVYGSLLTKFFEVYSYPDLAWMHHVACGRYGAAAESLMVADRETVSLNDKHLISSIGKLAAVAEIKAKGDVQQRQLLSQIDDELDGISIQNDLRETFTTGKSLDKYLADISTRLQDRAVLRQRFIDLAKSLAAGQALETEDLIDVLTLKDNRGDFSNDPTVALGRLINDTTLPEGRKQVALVSTWRRIYIRDDWSVVADTKGRSEEAQREMLRATLPYQTLKATVDDAFPPAFIISPYDALTPPFTAELSARFPSWDGDSIDALMADHEAEIATLRGYVETHGLERLVQECAELVRRDRTGGDVEM